jgi:hypothetical protein
MPLQACSCKERRAVKLASGWLLVQLPLLVLVLLLVLALMLSLCAWRVK